MEHEQAVFEGWAIVELMGHQSEIGFVKTQAFGQAVLFRIDTPELPEREYTLTAPEYFAHEWHPAGSVVKRAASPARSRLVSPGSLYAINPCTEEAARTALERIANRPLILVSVPARGLEPQTLASLPCCPICGGDSDDCICPDYEKDAPVEPTEPILQNEAAEAEKSGSRILT